MSNKGRCLTDLLDVRNSVWAVIVETCIVVSGFMSANQEEVVNEQLFCSHRSALLFYETRHIIMRLLRSKLDRVLVPIVLAPRIKTIIVIFPLNV